VTRCKLKNLHIYINWQRWSWNYERINEVYKFFIFMSKIIYFIF